MNIFSFNENNEGQQSLCGNGDKLCVTQEASSLVTRKRDWGELFFLHMYSPEGDWCILKRRTDSLLLVTPEIYVPNLCSPLSRIFLNPDSLKMILAFTLV